MTCPCFNPLDGRIQRGKECCDIKELAIMPLAHLKIATKAMPKSEWEELKPKVVARRKLIREEREVRIKSARDQAITTLKGVK
ncbi:hypothetical protein [Solimicrobium silvestre]|uniref:Uncharacterized protein n=1 Tax=Solimicrobium silvestre TaxID=2099400 RepID=A0A2S9GYC1_9BURK|nr:hypothetical protein [Solimicrobium silvestre]PRC92656.1 hypothetical protein S2091_2711 [Solimicrobium silvestre]